MTCWMVCAPRWMSPGCSDNTYIVATSDNGFHMGQHGLGAGKSTPYASDVVVPLVVLPPGGLAQPVVVDHVVQNVDFLPTFLDLAGAETPASVDGWSFAAAIDGSTAPSTWREGALIEFSGEDELRGWQPQGRPGCRQGARRRPVGVPCAPHT